MRTKDVVIVLKIRKANMRFLPPAASDQLFQSDHHYQEGASYSNLLSSFGQSREPRDIKEVDIFDSTILSGNLAMKSLKDRDFISQKYSNAIYFKIVRLLG